MTGTLTWRGLPALTLLAVLVTAPLASGGNVRLKVKNKVISKNRDGDTRSNKRQLVVEIDNRNRETYQGVTMEWIVIARDIRNRKLSIAGSGSKQIDIPAEEEIEVRSEPFSFSKTEGKVEEIRENRFRPDRQQFKVDPDSGTRYAGYIVTLKKGDELIAESATAGMKKRIQPLLSGKKK